MLEVSDLYFSYSERTVLRSVSLTLDEGKNMAIIGESGCGKSTLLKLIYGLFDADKGEIKFQGEKVTGPKYNLIPGMEMMKYLAQDFDLMPYITVGENVGKYLSNFYPAEKQTRIDELLETVEMSDFKNVKAKNLSGGQMQRVAIARVLALEPKLLLLDEPFSHIDNFRKNALRRKLFAYLKSKGISCIIATHDSTDMLSFTDEVVVMKEGEIVAKGTPQSVYATPQSYYVASLFGDVNALVLDGEKRFLYPNQLQISASGVIKAEVVNSYFKGSHYLIEVNDGNQILFIEHSAVLPKGSQVYITTKGS